ncbi:hypothetical protein JMJ35_009268 [Cladonia borealis]|uniref:Uncharacterized protein n=1 Tax=Cladonia borealis TaxID=184061 RepID=A0AA39V239_9LECA|nr:hypothetical protein JMJ35_009268 [Cladonia borealis]
MITLSDKEQLLLQAAITNATVPDLANSIDFEKVAEVTGHANKGVARTMFKRLMDKIQNGGQPTKTLTPPKPKKRKADDMADKGDKSNAKVAEEELGEEAKDLKAKIKEESQQDALESE